MLHLIHFFLKLFVELLYSVDLDLLLRLLQIEECLRKGVVLLQSTELAEHSLHFSEELSKYLRVMRSHILRLLQVVHSIVNIEDQILELVLIASLSSIELQQPFREH